MKIRVLVYQADSICNDRLRFMMEQASPGSSAGVTFNKLSDRDDSDFNGALEAALDSTEPVVVVTGFFYHAQDVYPLDCRRGDMLAYAVKERRPDAYTVYYTTVILSQFPYPLRTKANAKADKYFTEHDMALAAWLVQLITEPEKGITLLELP